MIRRYSKNDKKTVLDLLVLNVPKYFAPEEEQLFSAYLDEKIEDYFVYEKNGEILAAAGINYEKSAATLSWGMVHPGFHAQGIGTEITKYRIEYIKNNVKFKKIIVRTSQLTYKFYKKMGFRLQKTEPDYWGKGFDLYDMEMTLE